MARTVLKLKPKQIDEFIDKLRRSVSMNVEKPKSRYEKLRAKIGSEAVVVYTTGKVVVPSDAKVQVAVRSILRELGGERFDVVIGSDEAGKGEWLGPLTVAAVALDRDIIPQLQVQGVMDSKELSLGMIRNLVEPIRAVALGTKVLVISPSRFNDLFAELREEGRTLNDLLAWGHRIAIDVLLTDSILSKNVKVVIDEFDSMKTSREVRKLKGFNRLLIIQEPKAEEEIAVAAASILARAAREDWIDRETRRVGFDLRSISPERAKSITNVYEIAKIDFIR